MNRQDWIDMTDSLALTRQCALASVTRSTVYAHQKPKADDVKDMLLCSLVDEEYTRHPFYGTRRMAIIISKTVGYVVCRKRIQSIMRLLGLQGMAPGPNTSRTHPKHPVYPYLLRGVQITRPNQVWSTDITYIRLANGFVYLVVIIDWYSRKILSWRISNSMDATFCVDCLEEALRNFGKSNIFNTDQGSQFTADRFTGVLIREGITISMDGRGRAFDNIFVERFWRNVKYEDIYLKGYGTVSELKIGLSEYFTFYNQERPHQALQYKTPDDVYESGQGGGALILDKFDRKSISYNGLGNAT